jgi:hypothetical protein
MQDIAVFTLMKLEGTNPAMMCAVLLVVVPALQASCAAVAEAHLHAWNQPSMGICVPG